MNPNQCKKNQYSLVKSLYIYFNEIYRIKLYKYNK